MIKLGSHKGMEIGQRATARALSKCEGGYIVEFAPNRRGLAVTDAEIGYGKEILVEVTGYRQGMPVVHALFAGFR